MQHSFRHSLILLAKHVARFFHPFYRTFFSSFPWGTYFSFKSRESINSRSTSRPGLSHLTWLSLYSWKKEQIKQLNGYSLFLRPLKLRSKIFPKRSHRNRSNFAIIEAAKGGTSSLKRFSKKLQVPRNSKASKRRNGAVTLPW